MKSLVILAGGNSIRMGTDKTFLISNGKTFLEHLLGKSEGLFDRIYISAGTKVHARTILEANLFLPVSEKIIVVPDHYESIGPMGGLMSVFEETGLERFAVTAVDLPFADLRVNAALLDRLNHAQLLPSDPCAVMLSVSSGHIEACTAAYAESAYHLMKAAYHNGQYGILRAIGTENSDIVTAEEIKKSNPELAGLDFQKAFKNINTPEDL